MKTKARLRVREDDSPRITFKPSVDITFGTAAKVFNDKVLAIVLTGMGSDGREGCRLLKQSGSRIWSQDEASCVVYGMPQAVTAAGLTDVEVALSDVAARIVAEVGHGYPYLRRHYHCAGGYSRRDSARKVVMFLPCCTGLLFVSSLVVLWGLCLFKVLLQTIPFKHEFASLGDCTS